jgi:hypothetical protein
MAAVKAPVKTLAFLSSQMEQMTRSTKELKSSLLPRGAVPMASGHLTLNDDVRLGRGGCQLMQGQTPIQTASANGNYNTRWSYVLATKLQSGKTVNGPTLLPKGEPPVEAELGRREGVPQLCHPRECNLPTETCEVSKSRSVLPVRRPLPPE